MSILSVHDLQGIAAYQNKIRIPSGHQLNFDGNLKIPVWTLGSRPVSPEIGLIGYNTTDKVIELYDGTVWVNVGRDLKGTSQSPIVTRTDTIGLTTGAYYVQPSGYTGTSYQTYVDNDTLSGGWMLAFVVTNINGSELDWFVGDNWNGTGTGTDYFSTISVLNTSSLLALNKTNAKHPLFDYYSFSELMIRENFTGTIGNKGYVLNTLKSFRSRFTDGSNPIDGEQTYNNQVSSIIGTTGTMGATFTTNTLDFNYTLTNDGARISATPVVLESVGGISSKVDNGRAYNWKGNLTRSDSGRTYNNVGWTADHTAWFFVR